ncbi:hypothetical protein CVT24_009274 [Panaeolus cyanescens]|uniref:Uncharacterized protein n=1 Tax=Panaeolus cyanescens TaxID=181874 RepID=A0A409Y8B7_9AGAR|nr:hypothetical protein CVT24_009274 [Panaeolus cyanescens]
MEPRDEMRSNKAVASRPTSHSDSGNGVGKKKKRFLGQNDVLSLAASIAETQEKKSAARIHKPINEVQSSSSIKPKKLSARNRIKEKKAILQAQRAEAKKNKAKLRKQEKTQDHESPEPSTSKRKGVSFA